MKKILNILLIAAVFAFAGCEEAETGGTIESADPTVTIYQYTAPAEYNPEETISIRYVPNDKCAKFYALFMLASEREALIEAQGEAAFAAKVVSEGTEYTGVTDILYEKKDNIYAFCAVAVGESGNQGLCSTTIYRGAHWSTMTEKAKYTDDIVGPLFGGDPVTYDVTIQYKDDSGEFPLGMWRLVNAYGADFPYNKPGQWDDTTDYYFTIDITDAKKVTIPANQSFGVNWGYGMMGFYQTQAAGTMVDNVVTFPVKALTLYDDDGKYYANNDGAFKIVLPKK